MTEPFQPPERSERSRGSVPAALLMLIAIGSPLSMLVLALGEAAGFEGSTLNLTLLGFRLSPLVAVALNGLAGAFVGWDASRVWAHEPAGDRVYDALLTAACPLLFPGCLLGVPVGLWAAWEHAQVEPPSDSLAKGAVLTAIGLVILAGVVCAG